MAKLKYDDLTEQPYIIIPLTFLVIIVAILGCITIMSTSCGQQYYGTDPDVCKVISSYKADIYNHWLLLSTIILVLAEAYSLFVIYYMKPEFDAVPVSTTIILMVLLFYSIFKGTYNILFSLGKAVIVNYASILKISGIIIVVLICVSLWIAVNHFINNFNWRKKE